MGEREVPLVHLVKVGSVLGWRRRKKDEANWRQILDQDSTSSSAFITSGISWAHLLRT